MRLFTSSVGAAQIGHDVNKELDVTTDREAWVRDVSWILCLMYTMQSHCFLPH